jgi:hypothetical protein
LAASALYILEIFAQVQRKWKSIVSSGFKLFVYL